MPPLPFKRIGSIWLPGGGEFEVWSNYAIAIPNGQRSTLGGRQLEFKMTGDDVCHFADPWLPAAYFPAVRTMFAEAGLLPAGHWLHWVGRQTEIEHVCTCFGILEPAGN